MSEMAAAAPAMQTKPAGFAWSQFAPLVAVFVVFIIVLLLRPEGLAGAATARRV